MTMRAWKVGLGASAAVLAAAGVGVGCLDSSDGLCEFSGTCMAVDAGGDATPVVDGGQDDATDALTDVYTPPDGGPCTATDDPHDTGCKAQDGTGIFVDVSAPSGGDGTKGKPLHAIGDAIALLSGGEPGKVGRIYVCGGKGDYVEKVTIDATLATDVQIFGSLSCDTWSWTGGATVHVMPSAPDYALRVDGATKKIEISDVSFEAPAASGYETSGAGKSSVAAFVSNGKAEVSFRRVMLKANAGMPGKSGDPITAYAASATPGNQGTSTTGGGQLGPTQCANNSGAPKGGAGGDPNNPGNPGGPGINPPQPDPAYDGLGGSGANCSSGTGHDGSYGLGGKTADGGAGSGAVGAGTLSGAGWVPQSGVPGGLGTAGQGGGGGAGQSTGGGGSGGLGGCGGAGGNAGGGAGASIALLVYKSTVSVTGCTLSVAAGVPGGAGGKGQNGQAGGIGGNRGGNGCNGGAGGVGGSGGGGGGGAGGVSLSIGYVGATLTIDHQPVSTDMQVYSGDSTLAVGSPGSGGGGGDHGAAGAGNPPGIVGDVGAGGANGIAGAIMKLSGT